MQERAPASIKQFEERLIDVSESLPKRLRQCAEYVAANKDRIAVSTVAEMAEGAGVQPSAFMRFCRILGFSGFSEMQRLFPRFLFRRQAGLFNAAEEPARKGRGHVLRRCSPNSSMSAAPRSRTC